MKSLIRFFTATVLALASWVAVSAYAQAPMTDGEVRKVDKDGQKITLRHGEIKNLDMPAMTMVFNVKDPGMLDKLKPGDKVQFRVADEGGRFTVTEIQPAN
jgi:Cu(I)/Ag(I) efflux system protein CusF